MQPHHTTIDASKRGDEIFSKDFQNFVTDIVLAGACFVLHQFDDKWCSVKLGKRNIYAVRSVSCCFGGDASMVFFEFKKKEGFTENWVLSEVCWFVIPELVARGYCPNQGAGCTFYLATWSYGVKSRRSWDEPLLQRQSCWRVEKRNFVAMMEADELVLICSSSILSRV